MLINKSNKGYDRLETEERGDAPGMEKIRTGDGP